MWQSWSTLQLLTRGCGECKKVTEIDVAVDFMTPKLGGSDRHISSNHLQALFSVWRSITKIFLNQVAAILRTNFGKRSFSFELDTPILACYFCQTYHFHMKNMLLLGFTTKNSVSMPRTLHKQQPNWSVCMYKM